MVSVAFFDIMYYFILLLFTYATLLYLFIFSTDFSSNIFFDPNEFPLLNSIGMTPMSMDCLVREIVKFHGHRSIKFIRGNNRPGSLILMPSHSKLERYEAELSKKNSAIDVLLDSISTSSSCEKDEAAECMIKVLYKKFEESFAAVAIEMNVMVEQEPEKKMDVVSTEAMLQEANVTTKSARILSRHLRQHFGRSLFASESERRKYFSDIDFSPMVKTKILEDKTIIPFWYKRPEIFLQKQLKNMIDLSLLPQLIKVDIIIGGDHGGGKFRMSMKVNFRLVEKKTHSYLTQIASVSYSKDNTEILKETVLNPIGEGLELLVSGGKFIVLDNDYNLQFSLSNTTSRTVHCNCPVQVYLAGDLKFYAQMSGREDMSSFWCMWCVLHPNSWKTFHENNMAENSRRKAENTKGEKGRSFEAHMELH